MTQEQREILQGKIDLINEEFKRVGYSGSHAMSDRYLLAYDGKTLSVSKSGQTGVALINLPYEELIQVGHLIRPFLKILKEKKKESEKKGKEVLEAIEQFFSPVESEKITGKDSPGYRYAKFELP